MGAESDRRYEPTGSELLRNSQGELYFSGTFRVKAASGEKQRFYRVNVEAIGEAWLRENGFSEGDRIFQEQISHLRERGWLYTKKGTFPPLSSLPPSTVRSHPRPEATARPQPLPIQRSSATMYSGNRAATQKQPPDPRPASARKINPFWTVPPSAPNPTTPPPCIQTTRPTFARSRLAASPTSPPEAPSKVERADIRHALLEARTEGIVVGGGDGAASMIGAERARRDDLAPSHRDDRMRLEQEPSAPRDDARSASPFPALSNGTTPFPPIEEAVVRSEPIAVERLKHGALGARSQAPTDMPMERAGLATRAWRRFLAFVKGISA